MSLNSMVPRYGSTCINRQAYDRLGDLFVIIADNINLLDGHAKEARWWNRAWRCYERIVLKPCKLRVKKKYYKKLNRIIEEANKYVSSNLKK